MALDMGHLHGLGHRARISSVGVVAAMTQKSRRVRCRKHTSSVLTGELRWRGRILEQEWQYTETDWRKRRSTPK